MDAPPWDKQLEELVKELIDKKKSSSRTFPAWKDAKIPLDFFRRQLYYSEPIYVMGAAVDDGDAIEILEKMKERRFCIRINVVYELRENENSLGVTTFSLASDRDFPILSVYESVSRKISETTPLLRRYEDTWSFELSKLMLPFKPNRRIRYHGKEKDDEGYRSFIIWGGVGGILRKETVEDIHKEMNRKGLWTRTRISYNRNFVKFSQVEEESGILIDDYR
jgi:hypothetical protein